MTGDGFYDVLPPIVPVEVECGRGDDSPDPNVQAMALDPYEQSRPFQEDGHLADDLYHEEHDDPR
jgi:hypothetical protein